MAAALLDPETAPIPERLRAALRFIRPMVLEPEGPSEADGGLVRAAGLDDEAMADVVYTCAAFLVIVRLADTFEFEVPSTEDAAAAAPMLLKRGYRM